MNVLNEVCASDYPKTITMARSGPDHKLFGPMLYSFWSRDFIKASTI